MQRRSRSIFQFGAERSFQYHNKAFTKNRLKRHTVRIWGILLKRVLLITISKKSYKNNC
ncbi:hypothetical protein [Vibrio phage 31Fb.4]|nr:hypothetical protein [Vibrio phage 31Fb.4]